MIGDKKMSELKHNLNLFNNTEEVKEYTKYLSKMNNKFFDQFKTGAEMDAHIDYMNTREFVDELMRLKKEKK